MGEGENDVNRPVCCVDPHILLNDWSSSMFLTHLVLKNCVSLISHFKISEIRVCLSFEAFQELILKNDLYG